MDDVSLLDLIDDHWDALDLPQITLLSQTLSEVSSRTGMSEFANGLHGTCCGNDSGWNLMKFSIASAGSV